MPAISKLQFGSNLRPSLVSVMNKMNDVIDTVNTINAYHLWSGTQAEYDDLSVKDATTVYLVG